MPFAEDMGVFFNPTEFASAVVWGAFTANGILDMPTEDILGGRQQSEEYQLMLAASDLPGIARGASITVDAVSYKVREVKLVEDGRVKTLLLSKV